MSKIVDVQLGKYGRIRSFDTAHFVLQKGDEVLVETEQGPAFGVVCSDPRTPREEQPAKPLNKIYRVANEKDRERFEKNCELEKKVYAFTYMKIKERSLPMCLVAVECLFDGSKVTVYFTADGRVDFRELVRDLVQRFHTRIEMRQIGVRHEAKMVGGLGACGRQLCCTSFLTNFQPVSIRMAKEQNLSLNPPKISGMCGRLMCCLAYEYDFYEEAKKNLPKVGKKVNTAHGKGKVVRHNIFKQKMTVQLESGEEKEIPYSDILGNNKLEGRDSG
ncbi:MAG: stage 0 sporulation family protein [Deltaproteobacteria bacterium]|nr:stage 0 sporulation family protein [Deltaproteobacteria bacterium]MBW1919509.1 stage 0 sporulation family protein [Deltaproteobacteria bacterium]MBW1934868.1 stage 0 sporulation family protein [Deltaproteobacteria bacterium]MBW1978028.1 stage 0 sporulation family protein [Deltaproteobacteria bacterium]MBW2045652.1 stage 0 sporulation family protein [Deltaproteobacteria bacterium]